MAHVYRHNTHGWQVLYIVYLPDGTQRKKTKYNQNKDRAYAILRDVQSLEDFSRKRCLKKEEVIFALNQKYIKPAEAALLAGAPVSTAVSWEDVRKQYEEWSRANCSERTHTGNMARLGRLLSEINFRPNNFSKEDVEAYLVNLRQRGVKSDTINKRLTILRKLIRFVDPSNNVGDEVHFLRVDDEEIPRPIYPSEFPLFFKTVKEHSFLLRGYFEQVVYTYLYAGLRPTEIVNLLVGDVNLSAGKIYVHAKGKVGYRTKTGNSRSVDIHPELEPYLRRCVAENGKYLFGKDRQLRVLTVNETVRRVIKKLDIDGVTPYSLRHSFVSYMLRAGATLKEVMEQAGHKKITTTMRYLHVIPATDSPVKKIRFGPLES